MKAIFGGAKCEEGPQRSLPTGPATGPEEGAMPKFYQWCGTEDFLYQDNLRFRDFAKAQKLPLTYEESPGGPRLGLLGPADPAGARMAAAAVTVGIILPERDVFRACCRNGIWP